jgi:hypothetical protein
METTTNEIVVPEHYNPNQLVTYKVIDNDEGQEVTNHYPTVKVVDLEWELHQSRYNAKNLAQYISRVNMLSERLPDYLEMDSEEIVSDICSIFGLNPTKEISFEATATINGTVTVALADLKDFNIEDVDLNVYADSYSHDVDVDIELDNISTVDY